MRKDYKKGGVLRKPVVELLRKLVVVPLRKPVVELLRKPVAELLRKLVAGPRGTERSAKQWKTLELKTTPFILRGQLKCLL